ncbi:hypothetical protein O3P69_000775 [Scylla paramamosain]|uniref:Uncharacterized protein n=1 Tax=Scylla paramamosain TaxID=85552 RepID=A0AAW0UVG2_SCYPA
MLSVAHGMPQFFNKWRTFPGLRLRGATNNGTHSFSERLRRQALHYLHVHSSTTTLINGTGCKAQASTIPGTIVATPALVSLTQLDHHHCHSRACRINPARPSPLPHQRLSHQASQTNTLEAQKHHNSTMNFKIVLIVVLVVMGTVMGRAFHRQRQFPGQRLRGATHYAFYSFGRHGYESNFFGTQARTIPGTIVATPALVSLTQLDHHHCHSRACRINPARPSPLPHQRLSHQASQTNTLEGMYLPLQVLSKK